MSFFFYSATTVGVHKIRGCDKDASAAALWLRPHIITLRKDHGVTPTFPLQQMNEKTAFKCQTLHILYIILHGEGQASK